MSLSSAACPRSWLAPATYVLAQKGTFSSRSKHASSRQYPRLRLHGVTDREGNSTTFCRRIIHSPRILCLAEENSPTEAESPSNRVKTTTKPRGRGFGDTSSKAAKVVKAKSKTIAAPEVGRTAPEPAGIATRESGPRKPGVRRRPAPERPLVAAQASEEEKQIDNTAVLVLGVAFALIFGEGVFLSAAGFLPGGFDDFAVNVVYPAFSPSVILFLLLAASYGLYKYLGGLSAFQKK